MALAAKVWIAGPIQGLRVIAPGPALGGFPGRIDETPIRLDWGSGARAGPVRWCGMVRSLLTTTLMGLALALAVCMPGAKAQELPRRGQLGVAASNGADGRVVLAAVLPGSAAQRAGLAAGDVVVAVNGRPVPTAAAFYQAVKQLRAGDTAAIDVLRGTAALRRSARLAEAPRESDAQVRTIYGAVTVAGARRRTLLTVPRGATRPLPAMLLIGGIGCYSIDDAAALTDPYMRLAHDLGRRGIAVMRLEKSGIGDSEGPACDQVDFETELAGNMAAFEALRNDRQVNPSAVFVFGHSIGAAGAPQVGARHASAGVIVAQGFGRSWVEYEMINARRQIELGGGAPAEVDAAMMVKAQCLHRLLVAAEPRDAVLADLPACAELQPFPASQAYMHQLTKLNMAEIWGRLSMPVLLIYGTSDFVTDEADHRRLAGIVNGAHPGAATLVLLPGMDHYLAPSESMAASLARVSAGKTLGNYDSRFSAAIGDWICARAPC